VSLAAPNDEPGARDHLRGLATVGHGQIRIGIAVNTMVGALTRAGIKGPRPPLNGEIGRQPPTP
jgi:hypothetical protein